MECLLRRPLHPGRPNAGRRKRASVQATDKAVRAADADVNLLAVPTGMTAAGCMTAGLGAVSPAAR